LVAADFFNGCLSLDLNNLSAQPRRMKHPGAIWASVSRDGEWIATSTHHGSGSIVWKAADTEWKRDLVPEVLHSTRTFSPDSRSLVAATSREIRVYDTASWDVLRRIPREQGVDSPGRAAFTPDGGMLAVTLSPSQVVLLDPARQAPLARLEAPDGEELTLLAVGADGSKLIASSGAGRVRVWDLRRVRERLREVGLDWDQPPYAPAAAGVEAFRVEVQIGDAGVTAAPAGGTAGGDQR
jgi:WD40 repeat protein